MCGRFTLRTSPAIVAEHFELPDAPLFEPRYNIAPSQNVAAVRLEVGKRRLVQLRRGLIPFWATDPKIAYRLINARSDTAASKPAFRAAFRSRRCLIPADGFFEWKKQGSAKQPFYIRREDGQPFGFAGLWEQWQPPEGGAIETCTILTTDANHTLAALHDRMPVILEKKDYSTWLEPTTAPVELQALLRPAADDLVTAVPVSSYVNSPRNEGARCIEAFEPAG